MNQQAQVLDGYMTPEELAEQLGKSLITLARWRSQRRGPPFIKVGLTVRYEREAVAKWLKSLAMKPQF